MSDSPKEMIDIPFWTWVPKVSVGPFRFGESIENYIKQYDVWDEYEYDRLSCPKEELEQLKRMHELGRVFKYSNSYIIPKYEHSFIINTEDKIIVSIRIETYLYYNNQDIIMAPLEKAMKIIGRTKWDSEDKQEFLGELKHIYYFDDLALSLWTLDNQVVTAYCDDDRELPDDYYDDK